MKMEHAEGKQGRKQRGQAADVWHQLKKNKGAMIGLALIILIVLATMAANLFLDYDTQVIGMNVKERLQRPGLKHFMGTDDMGRDIFWRILYGAKYSLSVGVVAVIIALVIGVPLGAVAGYFGGMLEDVIMRITDIFAAVPNILMAIVVVSALGQGMGNLMIAVGLCSIPQFVRITRASVLTVRDQEYVEAARAVPLERIMIETDSPYMAPVPHRGTRNDSGYVRYVCERLAEIKGVPPADCAAITLETGKRFFRIP